jgi:hypothetical protein
MVRPSAANHLPERPTVRISPFRVAPALCCLALAAVTPPVALAQPGQVQEFWTDRQPPSSANSDQGAGCSLCQHYGGLYAAGTEAVGNKSRACHRARCTASSSPAPPGSSAMTM